MMYARPLPFPLRSARRLTASWPVITESPISGSLLEMPVTEHAGAASPASVAATVMDTGIICLFGGQSDATLGVTLAIVGFVESRTVTVNPPVVVLPCASVDEQATGCAPIANVAPDAGAQMTGGAPSTASDAAAVNVTTAPL